MNASRRAFYACLLAANASSCTLDGAAPASVSIPPPQVSIELPLEPDTPRKFSAPRACMLRATAACVDLDPRPFEPCLVSERHCTDQGDGGVLLLAAPAGESMVIEPR